MTRKTSADAQPRPAAALDGPDDPVVQPRRRRPRQLSEASLQARAQRAARLRDDLLASAAQVVGECGYRDASVQRITAAAGVAQGTFYLYFASRQALFDELLPHFGLQMLEHVRERMAQGRDFLDMEVVGLKAVFEYLSDHPWFWRVLNEAEVEAPAAWARHHEEVTRRYIRYLQRVKAEGGLRDYSAAELPTIAQFLVAARDYMYRSHLTAHAPGRDIPMTILKTYRKFIEHGLGAG
ncbi:MAG: TetR/AcrR family transcriptional regulator [Burkholderiaceae bacterium]|nr:TetR/AcrR family transcriptional regulator [Burkholderiaceae bacterium]